MLVHWACGFQILSLCPADIHCKKASKAVPSNLAKISVHHNPVMHAYGISRAEFTSPDKFFLHKWLLLYVYFYDQCNYETLDSCF